MTAQGADLKATVEVMGHSGPRLTARIYQHAHASMRTHAVNLLARALDTPPDTGQEGQVQGS